MSELSAQKVEAKRDRTLTPRAFRRLLNYLDEGADSDGRGYLLMRQRRVSYFDRRNCPAPLPLSCASTRARMSSAFGEMFSPARLVRVRR